LRFLHYFNLAYNVFYNEFPRQRNREANLFVVLRSAPTWREECPPLRLDAR